jgi:hypothetical protein
VSGLAPRRQLFVTALLVSVELAGTFRVQRTASRATEPFDRLGTWLAAEASGDDVAIVHSVPSVVCGVARYVERAGGTVPIASWVAPLRRREVPRDLVALARGRRRVLLVEAHTVDGNVPEEAWLRAHARLAGQAQFENAWIFVFRPGRGDVFDFGDRAGAGEP